MSDPDDNFDDYSALLKAGQPQKPAAEEEESPDPQKLGEYWNTFKDPIEVPRLTDEKLREFVDGCLSGRIFTLQQIPETMNPACVFFPLAAGIFSKYRQESLEEVVGTIYEDISKSLPRGINGCPFFLSFHIMHKKDWQRALKAIKAEGERRTKIELPADDE